MDSGLYSPAWDALVRACGGEDDPSPKITLKDTDGNTRVFPVAMIDNIIIGRLSTDAVDGWDKILPVILSDWLDRATIDSEGS